jgi:hypothetical protein
MPPHVHLHIYQAGLPSSSVVFATCYHTKVLLALTPFSPTAPMNTTKPLNTWHLVRRKCHLVASNRRVHREKKTPQQPAGSAGCKHKAAHRTRNMTCVWLVAVWCLWCLRFCPKKTPSHFLHATRISNPLCPMVRTVPLVCSNSAHQMCALPVVSRLHWPLPPLRWWR